MVRLLGPAPLVRAAGGCFGSIAHVQAISAPRSTSTGIVGGATPDAGERSSEAASGPIFRMPRHTGASRRIRPNPERQLEQIR